MKRKVSLLALAVILAVTGCQRPIQESQIVERPKDEVVLEQNTQSSQENTTNMPDQDYKSQYESLIASKNLNTRVLFMSAEYCGACKRMKPVMEQYIKDNPSAEILEIKETGDNSAVESMMNKYKVTATPTTIVVDELGNEISRIERVAERAEIDALVEQNTNPFSNIDKNKPTVMLLVLHDASVMASVGQDLDTLMDSIKDKYNVVKLDGRTYYGMNIASMFNSVSTPVIIKLDKDNNLTEIRHTITKEDMEEITKWLKQ